MDYAALYASIGIFVATAGAAAVAWWQAIQANRASVDARQAQIAALTDWQESATALTRAIDIAGMSARAGYASRPRSAGYGRTARWLRLSRR